MLLDRRAGCAATFDALLAAAEVAFAELRETAPAITHLAYEIDLGELPGLSEPAETAAVQAAVCACAPTLARILGIHTMAYEPGQRHSLGSTEAWRSTAIDRRVVDGREKDQAARKRLERQAEHTAAIRTARAEAASVEAARANAARA